MPPTASQGSAKGRAVRWKKRPGRCEPLLAASGGGTRKRARELSRTRRWVSCLGSSSQRRLYDPLGEVPASPVSKYRFDAIRPVPLNSHQAQRGSLGASAAPSSRDVQDAPSRARHPPATSPPPPPPPPLHERLDPPVTSPLTSPAVTMDVKKQQHQAGPQQQAPSRRKGGGGGQQQLRSPVVKRPAAAPVALQGWLHKQGSEGLMLWKKRWFVLSEYCLFYYKGPEEEKLLGSILLPSYKISPCSGEDRVYRKFAFKAEHTNMRTYYFAADTRELMVQWMNALSLASILQEGSSWDDRRSGRPSVSSISSLLNQSADDSDSGFHGYRPPRSGTTGTASTIPPSSSTKLSNEEMAKKEEVSRQLNTSHDSVVSNGWGAQKQGGGFHQPLYANAPPKPRRLAEHDDYGASSPEPSPDRRVEELTGKKMPQDVEGSKGVGFVPRIAQPQQPVRNDRSGIDVRYHYQTPVQQQEQQQQGSGSHAQVVANVERRTPDTYGRSNSTTPGPTGANKVASLKGGDYEDVYNTSDTMRHSGSEGSYGEVYKRSSSQVAYIKGAGPVISIHHKQNYPERGQADNHSTPQGSGQYGHSGQHQQNYAAFRYATAGMPPQQQPDLHAQNVYPAPPQQQPPQHHHQSVQSTRHKESRPNRYPPRPHSADFLDYDAKRYHQHHSCQPPPPHSERETTGSRDHLAHSSGPVTSVGDEKVYQEQQSNRVARLPRPKSSLDMIPPADPSVSDNYYWSEERYAQKMRQSASYVHQIPTTHQRNQSSSSRATTPSVRLSTPSGASMMTADGGMIHQQSGAQLGGVSSGGSVNSESAGVILRHPKRTELMPNDAATVRSPSRQQYQQQHQQRRWSEYCDPRISGQFMRSASARLPRQRYQDDENDSQCEEQRQKSTSDVREGEKKIQQREESMKRLLEWKQRMLQSPLTRKPSGSSTRGTAQNELSKYYKQQVLRELANQEARSRDLTNSQDGRGSTRRRSQMEDTGTVPGRSALRSRSQDGRRSSTSLSRYNSYSSDDEEPSEVRKARKRVRRPSQAGRSRHGSAERKPSRRHHHHHHTSVPPHTCTDMHSQPNYENVAAPFNAKLHHHHHHHHAQGDSKTEVSESRNRRSSIPEKQEEIPPDAAYSDDYRLGPSIPLRSKHHREKYSAVEHQKSPDNRIHGSVSCRIDDKILEVPPIQSEVRYPVDRHQFPLPPKGSKYPDTYPRSSSSTLKSSGDSTGYPSLQDDRCSNGKHSDSGYDTLQAGRAVPGFAELLKFQKSNINPRKSSELVYPVHELHWDPSRIRDPAKDKEEWNLKLHESRLMKELSYQGAGPSKQKGDGSKEVAEPRKIVESPPKNIVQSRIKAFEIAKEGEELTLGRESLQMQEPLKMSPPMYHPNEAHVSSLKNTEQPGEKTVVEDASRRGGKGDLRNFVFGDGDSSDPRTRLRKTPNESEKHGKSVRDLLADFERKSQLVKERQAAEEERSSEGGPGKRCVFSDTETLLYDTSSDAEGQPEELKQTAETSGGRQRSESRIGATCSDEDEEDKDEEVAAALGKREKFFSSCRDLGRNRDPEYFGDRRHRKRKSSKSSLTATDPTGSDDLEVIVTPGYLRLSMAESLVTHEDSDSVCSTPTNSQQYKTSEETGEIGKNKNPEESNSVLASMEEHYMPMTPSRKAVLAPPDAFSNTRSPSASHTVIMENIFGGGLELEESSYVEMTEDGLVRSLLAPEPNPSFLSKLDLKKIDSPETAPTYATPESPRYCEIGSSGKDSAGVTSHYEFLYKASTQYEPVYMEVSPLMEALKVRDKLDVPEAKQGGDKKENSESSTLQDSSEKSKSGGEEDGVEPLPPTPPRTSLPDILNSSSSTSVQQQQQKSLSKSDRDSSDADDEASKDLDSLDAPRHPRFSLSDTFRPASYYLGASSMSDRALMVLGGVSSSTVEHHDSSDSDLVSPPPIPTSPPPLDDFDNSLELHDASLEMKKQSPLPSKGGSESESNEKDESRMLWSKTPGNSKDKTDHEIHLIPPFIPSPVYGSGDINSSGSESVELRSEQESKTIDRLLKRRPVSDEMIDGLDMSSYLLSPPYLDRRTAGSDLESVGSRSGLAMDLDDGVSIDLDQYLEDLQARDAFNVDLYSKDPSYDYYRTYRNEMHGLNENFEKVPQKIEPSSSNTAIVDTTDMNYCFPERERPVVDTVRSPDMASYSTEGEHSGLPPLPYHQFERSPKSEEVQYENLQMILPPPPEHANVESPPRQVPDVSSPPEGVVRREDRVHPMAEPHGLDAQQAGAPYYYSDLLKGDEDGFASSTSERSSSRGAVGYPCFVSPPVTFTNRVVTTSSSRVQPLNNQRGDLIETACFVKRNDIGRKVNAIHQAPAFASVAYSQQVPSSEAESRRLAEELRSTTVHFLGTANKRGQVDERNLYEADTIQRRKGMAAISLRGSDESRDRGYRPQSPDMRGVTNAVNLYPHGLRDKSSPSTGNDSGIRSTSGSHQPQRRSRSLEGLLDDPDFFHGYSEPQSSSRTRAGSSGAPRSLQSSGLTMSLTNVPHSVASDTAGQNRNDLRDSLQNRQEGNARRDHQGSLRSRPPPPVPEEEGIGSCEGDDLWEEDALWRESLRRVSLRHTRSLDNLDGGRGGRSSSRLSNSSAATTTSTMEQSGATSSGRGSADLLSTGGCVRQKISREVTYVNDSMMRNSHHRLDPARQREYEEDYREGRRRSRRRPQQVQGRLSDEAAGGSERDDGVHYERLSRYSESLERTRRGQTYLEGYIWDEDQETFRKNRPGQRSDSATSRQQHQSPKQHFLENGSLPPQPSPPQPPPSFEIDREKLRQWDLMSSAPLLQQQMLGARQPAVVGGTDTGVVVGAEGEETLPDTGGRQQQQQQQQQQQWHLMDLTMSHADEMVAEPHGRLSEGEEQRGLSSTASGSGSVIGRDPLPPRAVSAMSLQQQMKDTPPPTITLTTDEKTQDLSTSNSLGRKASPSGGAPNHPVAPTGGGGGGGGGGGPHNTERSEPAEGQGKRTRGGGGGGGSSSGPWGINVSAGELLGRTHEELVLLLIQLRRQSAGVCKAMETCHVEIESQARLAELETPTRLEHLQKLDELKRHLLDLEKQYEKGKPLVNLVDNMVKLGSLYRGSGMPLHSGPGDVHSVRERLEFNQKVQEQRLLAEERRDWDRVSPDKGQLQAKVQELYRLDRLLQEESGTLQSLQQDKELLEKALGGLRHKLQGSRANPAEAERYRKQQRLLEKELSRIRLLLAHNSKKLEETVAENARLEQELVVLRQKLQASRRGSQQHQQRSTVSLVPDSASTGTTAVLEAELRRVQQLVGDLQRQRQELSIQVRHLTEKSHSLVQQIRPGPTGVAGAGPIPGRKRHHSTWLETDLDSLVTLDHGLDSPASPQHQTSPPGSKIPPPAAPSVENLTQAPLYVNTETGSKRIADQNIYEGSLVDGEDLIPPPLPAPPELPPDYPPPPPPPPSEEAMMNGGIGIGQQYCTQMDISEADDRIKRFYGILPREKQQEIKTVRIVKRESERRQRDRDRSGNIGIPISNGTSGGKRVTIVEDGDIGTTQYPIEKQQLGRVLEEDPQEKQFTVDHMAPEEDPVLTQFQRSMSLPRGFGKRERLGYQQQQVVPPLPPVRVPSPRSDSVTVLRNLMINRQRVRFESCSGGSTSSAESTGSQRALSPSLNPNRPLTAHEQLFGMSHDDLVCHHFAMNSPGSSDVSPQLSPVFKSEAARAIVMEMSSMRDTAGHSVEHQPRRRAVPKEKRRHHTVSSSRPLLDIETSSSPIMGSARSRDDLDMERALRPRLNAPDVVRSTMSHKDFKYNENTIDSILGTPNKIVIPERYIPEQAPELSAEEQLHRLKKAEAIRKMLSETTSITTSDANEKEEEEQTSTLKKKVAAEKKQREHLLQLNQILAKQVMEKSKMVAVKALATLPLNAEPSFDEDDLSPIQPLPLFQQRENYFS